MKMTFSSQCLTVIACYLVLISIPTYGKLIVLRHPLGNNDHRNFTCLADDDDAALIWNYNPISVPGNEEISLADFEPKTLRSKNITCARRNASMWIVPWENGNEWVAVNSFMKPMAYVHDFRWEDFREFIFKKSLLDQKYRYVGEANESADTVVFSARGSNDINVFLCETKEPQRGRCFWIIVGGWRGNVSAIRLCNKTAPEPGKPSSSEHCEDIANVTHKDAGIIDLYEWRTFTLKWDRERKRIQIFTGRDEKPFLSATLSEWHSGRNISVRSEKPSRIRFHLYDYFSSEQRNVKLTTKMFPRFDRSFCAKLLVGLCPECELNVTLVDTQGNKIERWQILGSESSIHNRLLTWRSIKLSTNLRNNDTKFLRLVIRTILNREEGRGQWAIDNLRICNPGGEIRKSTKLIHRTNSYAPDWPRLKCQKLSFSKSTVVDSFSNAEYRDTSHLQKFLRRRQESCGLACAKFGKKWSICDETGCTCDQGFSGTNCEKPCPDNYYGYNCKRKCGSCNYNPCAKTAGYCDHGCKISGYLPPFCKTEVKRPVVTDITATTAAVSQELEFETDADVEVIIIMIVTNKKLSTESYMYPLETTKSTYETVFENLTPNTVYKVHAFITVNTRESELQHVNSSDRTFTTGIGESCFKVLPNERNLILTTLQPGKKCADRTDLRYSIVEVFHRAEKTPACSGRAQLPYNCTNLTPFTEYIVHIYQADELIFSKIVWTLKLVLDKPRMLTWTNHNHGIVELKWKHPLVSQTHIKQFSIHIKRLNTELQRTPAMPDPMGEIRPATPEQDDYSMNLYLLTSTVYNVSVVAIGEHNATSMESVLEISVPGSVGFATGEKLEVIQKGHFVVVKALTIVNATRNTTVSIIIINEHETFVLNESLLLSSNFNMREPIADDRRDEKSGDLKIGIEESQDDDSNGRLYFGRTYSIMAIVRDFSSNSSANLTSSAITLIQEKQNLAWLAFLSIPAICLVLLLARQRFVKKRTGAFTWINQDTAALSSSMTSTGNSTVLGSLHLPTPPPGIVDHRVSIGLSGSTVVSCNFHCSSVAVEEFGAYAKEAMESGLLDTQFATLSIYPTKKCEYGKLPENLFKNRYKNLIPYDNTRVILKKIPGDSYSDYINASYIEGYRAERGYIATQGPKPNTVNDFWRMVWQEKVEVICMLTNLTEGGKSSCEQYWPEVGTGVKHGDFDIFNAEHEVFADFTIRNLNLCSRSVNRTVTHLHYTGWPDNGVPMHTQSLVAYLKKLLATPTGRGPVVVHCSAGIGRTGTIILCDICLRQAVSERIFDLPTVVKRMHKGRANMVEDGQQYFLAHLVIMESMVVDQTQIPCNCSLPNRIKNLRKQLPSDIQKLKDTVWQERALHSLAAIRRPSSGHVGTNGLPKFVPATLAEPRYNRDSTFDSESNYINAVSVDGVKMKKQYLESSLPTPSTLCEYWRLIAQKKIELILILQLPDPDNPTCCNITSKDSTLIPVPYIRVETKSSVDVQEHFNIQKFLMTDTSRKRSQQAITVLTCTGWKNGNDEMPQTAGALVSLWMASEKVSRKEAPTLVLCHDGVTGCGLYLALSFLLERMAVERECDVISAVRAVRRSRTEFVQSLEQFECLYDAAVNYYECFQTYANFS